MIERKPDDLHQFMSLRSATAVVVASIIGTGIYTSTGYQAASVGNPALIYALWILGGALAFCGAVCYGELGAMMPHAGGEYIYLRETYGGLVGFITAFLSLAAGFAAPIAVGVKTFVAYGAHFWPALDPELDFNQALGPFSLPNLVALALVWGLFMLHLTGVRRGTLFNDVMTLLKVGGIAAIAIAAILFGKGEVESIFRALPEGADRSSLAKVSALATALAYVVYTYTGWNGAAYMTSELKDPQRNLPKALLGGTFVVIALYVGINVVYFYGAGVELLAERARNNQPDVALHAAVPLFGPVGANLIVALILVSTLSMASALMILGPRVYYAIGRDMPALAVLSRVHARTGVPVPAMLLQTVVATPIVLMAGIGDIIFAAGYLLTISSGLAVLSVIVLRFTRPNMERPYRAWGYPVTPILYLLIATWLVVFAFIDAPVKSAWALLSIPVATGLYFLLNRRESARVDS
jgi:APA family basic amino acid/polyamine antiporter